ncbi:MAG: LacI family DNA-binding transcriptional regulator [Verrucomicrobiota bacterium]|nr:LacI family DNA-binding transcriptional regulator [Verrucomicrobiota bacterium]
MIRIAVVLNNFIVDPINDYQAIIIRGQESVNGLDNRSHCIVNFSMPEQPKLSDIARELGLSISTISLALRRSKKVHPSTIERVNTTAAKLGYRPDIAQRSIALMRWREKHKQQGYSVAYVHDYSKEFIEQLDRYRPNRKSEFALRIDGARKKLMHLGYDMEIHSLHDYESPSQLSKILYHRGIQGIIFDQILSHKNSLEIKWEHFACVSCHSGLIDLPMDQICLDSYRAMELCVEKLRQKGCRRPGLILFDRESPTMCRYLGALLAKASWFPEMDTKTMNLVQMPNIPSHQNTLEELNNWILMYKPDAVIAPTNTWYWLLNEMGYKIPEQLLYISMDAAIDLQTIPIMGIITDFSLMAEMAVQRLDWLILNNERGLPSVPTVFCIPPQWEDAFE